MHHDFSSAALRDFVGEDGLAHTLALIDPGKVRDAREWAELHRRLHLPNYEAARLKWSTADANDHFDGANQVSPYTQRSLRTIIEMDERLI